MEYWNDQVNLATDKAILQATYDRKMNVYGWVNGKSGGFTEEEKTLKYADVPCGIAYRNAGVSEEIQVVAADCEIKIFCDEGYEIAPGDVIEVNPAVGGGLIEFTRTGAAKHYGSHQELIAIHRAR